MQTARYFVAAAAEFAAGMELCQNDFNRRFAFLFDNAGGDASAVVGDANRAVFEDFHNDVRAVAGKRFVAGVVNDFGDKVMQTSHVRRTDIHAGAFSDGIEPFQNLNVAGVITVSDFFCHFSS